MTFFILPLAAEQAILYGSYPRLGNTARKTGRWAPYTCLQTLALAADRSCLYFIGTLIALALYLFKKS